MSQFDQLAQLNNVLKAEKASGKPNSAKALQALEEALVITNQIQGVTDHYTSRKRLTDLVKSAPEESKEVIAQIADHLPKQGFLPISYITSDLKAKPDSIPAREKSGSKEVSPVKRHTSKDEKTTPVRYTSGANVSAQARFVATIGSCPDANRKVNTDRMKKAIEDVFKTWDKDKDGVLKDDEVKAGFKKMHGQDMNKWGFEKADMSTFLAARAKIDHVDARTQDGISISKLSEAVGAQLERLKKSVDRKHPESVEEISRDAAIHAVPPLLFNPNGPNCKGGQVVPKKEKHEDPSHIHVPAPQLKRQKEAFIPPTVPR